MRSKALPGWAHTLCTAAAALVFLLAYELVVYRVPVTEIFLPVSSWSDEVIYSKQLAAAVQYGAPQGYFGFNESHAAVGTYAAWGPAVFLVYALPGLLLRGQNAFLWCNLLFVVLGWTFYARAARLGWKRQLAFAAALAAMNAPIRYVFSAMQEPLHYALMLAVLGCGILARRDKSRAAWAGLCVLCAVATLVRPYEAVLWLFPLALCRQDCRRIAVCVAGGTVSLGGTLVLMSKFYAPYFFTNVDVSPLQELARGQVVSAVRDVAHKLLDALRTVAEMLADQLANRSGGQYLLFFLLLGVTLVCLIVDARAGRPVFWKGCAAVTAVIVFLALLLMYRPVEGSRHTLVLDVLLLAALDVAPVYALRRALMRGAALIVLLGSALAGALAAWISGLLTRPLRQLSAAAARLARGEYDAPLPTAQNDEIGALIRAFSGMSGAIGEREAALRAQAEERQALIDALAHEMRTPLTAILGGARLLGQSKLSEGQQSELLDMMAREAARLSTMDERLLLLTRLGHERPERTTFDSRAMAEEALRVFDGVRLEGEGTAFVGERELTIMLLRNLVVNAQRAGGEAPVCVTLHPDGFDVTDCGCGMTEEQLAHAFEPFYKADKARTRGAGGAGLGLSLCRKIARLHRGDVRIESEIGKGTRVCYRFDTSL